MNYSVSILTQRNKIRNRKFWKPTGTFLITIFVVVVSDYLDNTDYFLIDEKMIVENRNIQSQVWSRSVQFICALKVF